MVKLIGKSRIKYRKSHRKGANLRKKLQFTCEEFLLKCLFYLQVHRLIRYLHRKKIIILMYHGLTDKIVHEGIENYNGLHLNVEIFRLQIEYLKKYYNVISIDQLIERCVNNTTIPNNSVVITFDDGYKSNYTLAYPVLKKFNVPATISITTDFIENREFLWPDRTQYTINMTTVKSFKLNIDNETLSFDLHNNNSKMECLRKIRPKLLSMPQESVRKIVESLEHQLGKKLSIDKDIPEIFRPLNWNEILEMIKSGIISIGSHNCTHVVLTRCSPENVKKELLLSKQLIEEKTGSTCRLFCYPNGAVGDFDHNTKKLLKEFGYSCALTTVEGTNDERSDIFELKRSAVVINKGDLIEFAMILSGIVGFITGIKRSILNILMKKRKLANV